VRQQWQDLSECLQQELLWRGVGLYGGLQVNEWFIIISQFHVDVISDE
jgi:hypothetical protein